MNRRLWLHYGNSIRFAMIVGAVFGSMSGASALKPPLAGAALGALSTTVYAVVLMAVLGGAETFLPRTRFGRWFARQPLLVGVAIKWTAYFAFVAALIHARVGLRAALWFFDEATAQLLSAQVAATYSRGLLTSITAMIVLFLVMLRQATRLVGERSMRDLVRGRYHQPRREERFFLFVDVVGSTPVAERLGPLAVHHYLDRIFQIASDPVDDCRGEIYQYVGDEMVVTWTLAEGRPEARPLACFFGIEGALARAAPEFEREFGTVPRLRAALHAGETVTGEIGSGKRAIVFHGDVMNTTSRIENATRELGRPFLASEDALTRLEGRERYRTEDLGLRELRGREAPVRIYAVSAPPA